jgi:protein SCO1/2
VQSRFSKAAIARTLLVLGFISLGYVLSAVVHEFLRDPVPKGVPGVRDTVATVLPVPMNVPAFTLYDQNGNVFTAENLKNNWTFVFFGFTHCPDICPTTLFTLDQAVKILRDQAVEPTPRVLFVSVDPERDTAERLAGYVSYYNPEFTAVTGAVDQLHALTRPMGIMFQRDPETSNGDDYLVNHSVAVLLIDPQARLRAINSPPHNAEAIAHDYKEIINSGDTILN